MIFKTKAQRVFQIFNVILLGAFLLVIIVPFINVIAVSLSEYQYVARGEVMFWPKGITLEGYKSILTNKHIQQTMCNTIFLTVLNTFLCLTISVVMGYALSCKRFIGKKLLMLYVLIPMYFSGGLIPFYITVDKYGITNSFLALILPCIVNTFNIIMIRNAILQIPQDLVLSAEIDGANDIVILTRIIFPLISATVAAFAIFSAVTYWNEWFNTMLFIQDKEKWTLQYKLRELIAFSSLTDQNNVTKVIDLVMRVHPLTLQMAAIIVTIIPIIAVYPFMQKYFIYGVMSGGVKE